MTPVLKDQHNQNFKASEVKVTTQERRRNNRKSHIRNGDQTRRSTRGAIRREKEGEMGKISKIKTKLTREKKDLRKSDQC